MQKLLASLKFGLPITLLVAFVQLNSRGIGDLDSWWHVKIGDQIRAGIPFDRLGQSWSLHRGNWHTSQWLSEWLMSITHQALGWHGLIWWRFLFGLILFAVFVITLAKKNGMPAVLVTTVISAFVLVPLIQERPAVIGLIFIASLAATTTTMLSERGLPTRIWLWIPATTLWANLHGSWVLAPVALGLAGVLAFAQHPTRALMVKTGILAIAVTGAGWITPIGWHGLALPFRLQATAGKFISEWQRTTLTDPLVFGLLIILVILIYLWARGTERPTRSELLWVLFWTAFAFTSFRNVGPALLFIAPVFAHRLNYWFESIGLCTPRARTELSTRWFIAVLGFAIAVSTIMTARVDPYKGVTPLAIAHRLAASSQDLRIINDYNASGPLIALGGDHVRLAVDGRADRFDPNWLANYFAMLKERDPDYYLLTELQPNAAVLDWSSPLISHLLADKHWRRVLDDGRYVLLAAPGVRL